MSHLLFLVALFGLHEIFKCPVGLCEAVLVATLEAVVARGSEPEAGPCPHCHVPGPGVLAAGVCLCVWPVGATLSAL